MKRTDWLHTHNFEKKQRQIDIASQSYRGIGYINPIVPTIANGCSILFLLKIFIKNGFFSRKLMFAYGQSEGNWP